MHPVVCCLAQIESIFIYSMVIRWPVSGTCLADVSTSVKESSPLVSVESRAARMRGRDVFVLVVDAMHNEASANVTVVLSHRRADCQREYCRTVIGLFEEAGQEDWQIPKGKGKNFI